MVGWGLPLKSQALMSYSNVIESSVTGSSSSLSVKYVLIQSCIGASQAVVDCNLTRPTLD